MKKLGRISLIVISLFIVAVMLCACGETADSGAKLNENGETYYSEYAKEATDGQDGQSQSGDTSTPTVKNRKIIEYIDLTVETKSFDTFISKINSAVEKSGGYVESSQNRGESYYGSESRTAELKLRIPKSKQSDFSDFISENGNVVDRSVTTEDVTNQYIDTQSRIKALKIEKETLEKMLAQSATVSDTLTVYERLTNVISEIESYQSKLNQLDSLIDYTTFTVYVIEVEKETSVEKQNWFVKTWDGLINSFKGLGNALLDFLSFIIIATPYWILFGVIALVVILIIRGHKKRKAKRKTQ